MKFIALHLIKVYQILLSPDKSVWVKIGLKRKRHVCAFYPTCSEYSIQAIEKYGAYKGSILSMKRIVKCRPGTTPKIDSLE